MEKVGCIKLELGLGLSYVGLILLAWLEWL
jgi:hypothetical protein